MKIENSITFADAPDPVRVALLQLYEDADILCETVASCCLYLLSYHPQEDVLRFVAVKVEGYHQHQTRALVERYWHTYTLDPVMDFTKAVYLNSFLRNERHRGVLGNWLESRGYYSCGELAWSLGEIEE